MSMEYFGVNSTYSPFSNSCSLRTITDEKFDIHDGPTFVNKNVIGVATGLIPTRLSFLDESFSVIVEEKDGTRLVKLDKVIQEKVGREIYPAEDEVIWFDHENMQSVFWVHLAHKGKVLSITGDFIMTTITAEFLNKEIRDEIFDDIFPIGSIYSSYANTHPIRGSWRRTAHGRVLVGLNEGDGSFNTSRKIGGTKTHTLSVYEMPSHSHGVNDPEHSHGISLCRNSIGDGRVTGGDTNWKGSAPYRGCCYRYLA